jgi:hypothetical protein
VTAAHATHRAKPTGLPRWARVAAVTVHMTGSIAWLALLTAVTAVQASTVGHRDLILVTPGAVAVLAVLVVAVLASGVVLAWGTAWGFRRWRWLVVKQAMVVVLVGGGTVAFVVGATGLVVRAVALGLLLSVIGVSMVKPGGRWRRGLATRR